jgi:hypothetical protein
MVFYLEPVPPVGQHSTTTTPLSPRPRLHFSIKNVLFHFPFTPKVSNFLFSIEKKIDSVLVDFYFSIDFI